MSTDIVLRTIGTLACIYTVGLFISVMSFSAINGVSFAAGAPCDQAGCHVAYQQQRLEPKAAFDETSIIHAAASLLVAEDF